MCTKGAIWTNVTCVISLIKWKHTPNTNTHRSSSRKVFVIIFTCHLLHLALAQQFWHFHSIRDNFVFVLSFRMPFVQMILFDIISYYLQQQRNMSSGIVRVNSGRFSHCRVCVCVCVSQSVSSSLYFYVKCLKSIPSKLPNGKSTNSRKLASSVANWNRLFDNKRRLQFQYDSSQLPHKYSLCNTCHLHFIWSFCARRSNIQTYRINVKTGNSEVFKGAAELCILFRLQHIGIRTIAQGAFILAVAGCA